MYVWIVYEYYVLCHFVWQKNKQRVEKYTWMCCVVRVCVWFFFFSCHTSRPTTKNTQNLLNLFINFKLKISSTTLRLKYEQNCWKIDVTQSYHLVINTTCTCAFIIHIWWFIYIYIYSLPAQGQTCFHYDNIMNIWQLCHNACALSRIRLFAYIVNRRMFLQCFFFYSSIFFIFFYFYPSML